MSGIGFLKQLGLHFSLSPGGYQFSTTTSTPVRVENEGFVYYFGSGLHVPFPAKTATLEDLKPKPIGSTIKRPPKDDPDNDKTWLFIANPENECGLERIHVVYNYILKYKNGFLSGGAPPAQSFTVNPKYIEIDDALVLSGYKTANNIMFYPSTGSVIEFLGAVMPMRGWNTFAGGVDILFGDAVKQVKSICSELPVEQIEDIDIINTAWTIKVEHPKFGNRTFVLLSTLEGKFYTFPLDTPVEEGMLVAKYIKEVTPSYPGWVTPFTHIKNYYTNNGKLPLNPLISWSINEKGTQAIGCLVEREPLTSPLLDQILIYAGSYPDYRSEQFVIGSAKIFAERHYTGSGESEQIKIDRLGFVELKFTIILTEKELDNYTFSVSVLNEEAPVDTSPMRMGIAYHKPVYGSDVPVDSIVELYMAFYNSEDQRKFHNCLDGLYGSEVPQYGKYIIKVNGSEHLSFPMNAFLNVDGTPIEFSCMKHMLAATTIYTGLDSLDLSTLSFFRTTYARIPVLERNVAPVSGGHSHHLKKKCAIQTDVFILGKIVQTKTCGNSEALSKITTYLAPNFDSQMTGVLSEWAATDKKYPLRANFRSSFNDDFFKEDSSFLAQGRVPPQWWGHVLYWPMWRIFAEMAHKEVTKNMDEEDQCTGIYQPLGLLNESTFNSFFWSNVYSYNHGNTDYLSSIRWTLVSEMTPGEGAPSTTWPINEMLLEANPDMDETMDFEWLAKKAVLLMKEIYPISNAFVGEEGQFSATGFEAAFGQCFAYYHAAHGTLTNSTDAFWMIDSGYGANIESHYVIRDYPWVWHFAIANYNKLIRGNNDRSSILVHPNGHYSIASGYVWCPTGDEPEAELITNIISIEAWEYEDTPFDSYDARFKRSSSPPISSRDGFIIDGVSFWNDTIKTSHIALHNLAFDTTESESDYYATGDLLYDYVTNENEPIIVSNGFRIPCSFFNNIYFFFEQSEEAKTKVKDTDVTIPFVRIAPLWG